MKRRAPGRRSRPCWNRRAPGFMREFTPASRCPSMYICLSMNRRGFFWHSFLKAVKQMTSRKLRGAREKFWQDRYYDSNVHFRAGPLRGDPLYPSQSGVPGARTLCAGVEAGPSRAGRATGGLAVVELSPPSNGRVRNCGDRIGLDGPTKRLGAARVDARCLLDLPGRPG
jgi:hypothetical protein